ncbi:MAG: glycosyltransferase family 4 protein [Gemmataceae bacterium]|nr:glycosyltransferase family 4 protein [Gemmataceae bacterium]MDW8242131.1 glycosyltransferase family 1 protein [Thermogemmata sp.]
MRVLFNAAAALRRRTGVGHTAWQLYQALVRCATQDEIWPYPGQFWHRLRNRSQTGISTYAASVGRHSARPWSRLLMPVLRSAYIAHFHLLARWDHFDLYHEPNLVPFAVPLPTIVTVHDLSVLLHPQWHPPERVRRHEQAFARGVARAAHLLVDSEAVRQEALLHLGLSPNRVTTVHCGVAEQFRPVGSADLAQVRNRWQLPARYLLCVGTIEPRKNLLLLMRAYCDLPASLRQDCPLVLAGSWGWKSDPERHFWETTGRHNGIRYLGYVPDADLPALYSGALALFYPSHYEGFGLPPVEMMACGGAAVVSTAAAVREVAGGNAICLDPHDFDAWRQALRRTIEDPHWLDQYRQRGPAYAARYRWDRAAAVVWSVYHRVSRDP